MPTMKPKVKKSLKMKPKLAVVKKPVFRKWLKERLDRRAKPQPPPPPDSDAKLLKKGYVELRRSYVDLLAEHLKLQDRIAACEATGGDHEDRLNAIDELGEPDGDASDASSESVSCRCAAGLEGKDPDCYVHGVSFDRSDRPSRTKAAATVTGDGIESQGEPPPIIDEALCADDAEETNEHDEEG